LTNRRSSPAASTPRSRSPAGSPRSASTPPSHRPASVRQRLAESRIGLFKTELFHPHGPWRDRDHLEPVVLDWFTWFNTERPHESIDDLTPAAAEQLHYLYRASLAEAG
jgi:putative transposase